MTALDRIDGISAGVAYKAPVKVVTDGAITLSGEQTINGVAVVTGDRVLVKDQADQTTNGIYDVAQTAWTRSLDFDGQRDVVYGTLVSVASSTDTLVQYRLTTANPVVFGTSAITFVGAYHIDTLARDDGRAILEVETVSDASKEFEAGATFTVDPTNPRHYNLKVGDSLNALTDDMVVDLVPASENWPDNCRVTIRKGDSSAYTVTVLGFDVDGEGTYTLTNKDASITCTYQNTDNATGPGAAGQKFERGTIVNVPAATMNWLGDGDKRLDVAIAALVGATAIPEGTSAFAVRDDAGDVKVYTPAAGGTLIFDDDADTVAAVAKLAASTFSEVAVTATRELTSADANFQIVTESDAASGVVRKVLVPLHGTPSTAIALQIPANMEHGAEILVRRPGNQTGAVTVALVGAGSINGDTAAVTIPRKRLFAIYVSNAAGNAPTVETSTTLEDLAFEVVEATGALTYEEHHNKSVTTTGNVTIPTTSVGMAGKIVAGGAHTISFNSTTTAALSTGDIVAYHVTSATTIDLVRIPNSSRLALS